MTGKCLLTDSSSPPLDFPPPPSPLPLPGLAGALEEDEEGRRKKVDHWNTNQGYKCYKMHFTCTASSFIELYIAGVATSIMG